MAAITATSANNVQSLNAMFKEVYADKIKDLVPSQTKMVNLVPFVAGDKQLGNQFNEPVILGLEGGFTYGGTDGDAFALNDIISFPLKNAQVKSAEMVLRSAISVGAASRSVSSKNAFERGTKLLVGNMLKSMYHRLEVQLMYGQSGIGEIESTGNYDGNGDYVAGPSVSDTVIKIKDTDWAAGIWVGLKAKIDIFTNDLATKEVSSALISSVDLRQKTIQLSAAIDGTALAGDDRIYFEGSMEAGGSSKEFKGLHAISGERSSLFGISNATEPLFQGNIVDVGASGTPAVLSFDKIEEAIARAVEKGLGEEEVSVLVNTKSWNDLLVDLAGKRRYDSSYSEAKLKQGSREIEFYGQNGVIKIIPSTFVKEGFAYAMCEKELVRVGSTDITFDPPGYEGEFFKLLENANGYEMRCYSDQALFTARPSCITQLRYIKNNAA